MTAHGRTVELVVVVDLATLLGLNEHPAELRGYGALPAPVLADLTSAAAGWLLTVTDGTGRPLNTIRYRPTAAMQDWITAARPTCTAPGCTTPVEWCERDHSDPYDHDDPAAGGATCVHNVCPRCGGHHQLKTSGGFDTCVNDDGSITTTTPAGHTYQTPPPQVLPTDGTHPPDATGATGAAHRGSDGDAEASADPPGPDPGPRSATEPPKGHPDPDDTDIPPF